VGMLYVQSLENGSDEGLLVKADSMVIAVNFDAEKLTCWAGVRDLVLFQSFALTSIAVLVAGIP